MGCGFKLSLAVENEERLVSVIQTVLCTSHDLSPDLLYVPHLHMHMHIHTGTHIMHIAGQGLV